MKPTKTILFSIIIICLFHGSFGLSSNVIDTTVEVSLIMGSGRMPPKAILNKVHKDSLIKKINYIINNNPACIDRPSLGSTPDYLGVKVNIIYGNNLTQSYNLVKGTIYGGGVRCIIDSDLEIEKLALYLAYDYDDVNSTEGTLSMSIYICMLPDSLREQLACPDSTSAILHPQVKYRPLIKNKTWAYTLIGRRKQYANKKLFRAYY